MSPLQRIAGIAGVVFCAVTLAACGSSPVLSQERLGPVVFGAPLESVESLLGEDAHDQIVDPECSMVSFSTYPGTLFMVERGVVTRADAAAQVSNVLGIRVGESLESVLEKHPEARVGPHKYEENGSIVTFPSRDEKSAIVLEASDGHVTAIRAGLQPSVSYVEHCS